MNTSNISYITIGKIGTTYGVHGWLKIHTYTEFGANILQFDPWYLQSAPGQWRPYHVTASKMHHNGLIVKFATLDTPEVARLLTNQLIGITREQLPALKKDDYYWSDLLGLTVVNQNNKIYGKVIYLLATGANDVLVIKDEKGKEHAIPFLLHEVIQEVDLKQGLIRVNWELI